MDFAASVDLAERLPEDLPPLAVDVDGTLNGRDQVVDPRVIPICNAWPSPLVVATGKSMPYPVAICELFGLERLIVAENGGVIISGPTETIHYAGDRQAAAAAIEAYREQGYGTGWDETTLVNRWRETELAVAREMPLAPLESVAEEFGLVVVDTGYAYHVKSPDVSKGLGLQRLGSELDIAPDSFAAIGDSENDVSTFELADRAIAVANADDDARTAADQVTEAAYGAGFLEAVEMLCETV